MNSGLLASVRKYPIGELDPFENFLTEAWAAVLRNVPELATSFLAMVTGLQENKIQDPVWSTQVRLPRRKGIVDLKVETESFICIFEHKTGTALSPDQLIRYISEEKRTSGEAPVYAGVIAGNNVSSICAEISPRPWTSTWVELANWIQTFSSRKEFADLDPVKQFITRDFLNLLILEGFRPMEKIEPVVLESYFKAQEAGARIKQLFQNIRDQYDWSSVYRVVPRSDGKQHPRTVREHYGRVGIVLSGYEDWIPNLTFAVVLDGEDHAIEPSDRNAGPDLCLIVDIDRKFKKLPYYELDEYKAMQSQMAEFAKKLGRGWIFYDHLADKGRAANFWHPLYIRKPFSAVIADAKSPKEQLKAVEKDLDAFLCAFLNLDKKNSIPGFISLRKKLGKY